MGQCGEMPGMGSEDFQLTLCNFGCYNVFYEERFFSG